MSEAARTDRLRRQIGGDDLLAWRREYVTSPTASHCTVWLHGPGRASPSIGLHVCEYDDDIAAFQEIGSGVWRDPMLPVFTVVWRDIGCSGLHSYCIVLPRIGEQYWTVKPSWPCVGRVTVGGTSRTCLEDEDAGS
jgi:hypothetical protein